MLPDNHTTTEHWLSGRYKIVGLLGSGGMGAVYLVEDQKLSGKRWAMKQMNHAISNQQGLAAEAQTLIGLDHPNLPNIVDYFVEEEHSYLVMDYIEGGTLQQRFEASGKVMELDDLISLTLQLCDVLKYLHEQSPQPVIHRDLKPSNILIDHRGRAILIDFGTARYYKEGNAQDTQQMGTFGFAAPEQFNRSQTDARTDMYSLGAILYYLATGGVHHYVSDIWPDNTDNHFPAAFKAVIYKLLRKNKSERFHSVEELIPEIVALQNNRKHIQLSSANKEMSPKRNQLIVILSLYPGAGSTHVAFWLSNRLRQLHVNHAYIEHPVVEPRLFDGFNGQREVPEQYVFATDRILTKQVFNDYPEWRYQTTIWYPNPPHFNVANWTLEQQIRMLYEIVTPISFVDASHHWDELMVEELIHHADHVLIVTGPNRSQLIRREIMQRCNRVEEWMSSGKQVSIIANRCGTFSFQKEWYHLLPIDPICHIPELDYSQLLEAHWRGDMGAFDRYACKEEWMIHFQPLMERVFPGMIEQAVRYKKWQGFWRLGRK
jgi:serine/threonine protein kinase